MKRSTRDGSCAGFRDTNISLRMLLAATACACLPPGEAGAVITVLSGNFDTVNVLDGEYQVGNNIWGAGTAQQVTADTESTAFEVTLSEHDQGTVASYPFIHKGIHWGGTPTADSGFPIRIQDVDAAPFQWSIDTSGAGGNWNAAFESFFSSTGGIVPDKAELMIWIDRQGPFGPAGSLQETVTIGGLDWHLYHQSSFGNWEHYIAYELVTPASSVSLDLEEFLADSLARGYLQPEWFMDNMEAGFEIWSDGEGLETTSFSARLNPVPEPAARKPHDVLVTCARLRATSTIGRHRESQNRPSRCS